MTRNMPGMIDRNGGETLNERQHTYPSRAAANADLANSRGRIIYIEGEGFFFGTGAAWLPAAANTSIEFLTAEGDGESLLKEASAGAVTFWPISGGDNVTVELTPSGLVINATGGAVNRGENLGDGATLLKSINTGVLYLRSVAGSSGIEVEEDTNCIRLTNTMEARNLEGGAEILSHQVNGKMYFRSLKGVGDVQTEVVGDSVEISSKSATPDLVTITEDAVLSRASAAMFVRVDSSSAPLSIALPDGAQAGDHVTVKDIGFEAATNTISVAAAQGIDRKAAVVLEYDGEAREFFFDGEEWWLV